MGHAHNQAVVAVDPQVLGDGLFHRGHLPIVAAIQPHAMLLAVRHADLRILQASANAPEFLGISLQHILGWPLEDVLGAETTQAISAAAAQLHATTSFRRKISLPGDRPHLVHLLGSLTDGLLRLELEPCSSDALCDRVVPPLEAAVMALQQPTTTTIGMCRAAAEAFRLLTGFDRVLIAQSHRDGGLHVIAEDHPPSHPSFLDRCISDPFSRHVDGSSRPRFLRTVANVGSAPVPLMALHGFEGDSLVDLTQSDLQSASAAEIALLTETGAVAGLFLAICGESQLGAAILCLHASARLPTPEMRSSCSILGRVCSTLIGITRTSERATKSARNREYLDKLRAALASDSLVAETLIENPEELLAPVDAQGALVRLEGYTRVVGLTPPLPEACALLDDLAAQVAGDYVARNSLDRFSPRPGHLPPPASSVLMVPIGNSTEDGVLWFRGDGDSARHPAGEPALDGHANGDANGHAHTGLAGEAAQRLRHPEHPWSDADVAAALALKRLLTETLVRNADVRQSRLSRYFDPLTKLANRQVLIDRLTERRTQMAACPDCLIFIDMDRFKLVNDTMGHAVGDELLVQVGRRLTETAGGSHLVARLGGDEFVVYCENTTLHQAQEVARSIIAGFQAPFQLQGKPFRCSISVGVAPAGDAGLSSIGDILHSADSAMYTAKKLGGNQMAVFEEHLQEELLRKVQLEQDIFQAIHRGEMKTHYQAQISLQEKRLIGFEALLRWHHPVYGNISPAEFIPLAERTDQIQHIGEWVLRDALKQIAEWRARFAADLFVAVNVSAKQLAALEFAERVSQALQESGLPSDALHLEVTESLLMQTSAEPQLNALQALGIRIAIDDFGTGYSSLSYLQRFAVSELKLDHTFLQDVGNDPRKTALFAAIVKMAHTLDLVVVAEGIEDSDQMACICRCFCDRAQGFLLSRPLSPASIEELLLTAWADGRIDAGSQ